MKINLVARPDDARLNSLLVDFFCSSLCPLHILEHNSFQTFVREGIPGYIPPSRKTIVQKLIPERVKREKETLSRTFDTIDTFAVTTDCWTSQTTVNYLRYILGYLVHNLNFTFSSLTAHWLEAWEMNSAMLALKEVVSHTAENLSEHLVDMLKTWKLQDKELFMLSDNASNMIAAANKVV